MLKNLVEKVRETRGCDSVTEHEVSYVALILCCEGYEMKAGLNSLLDPKRQLCPFKSVFSFEFSRPS